MADLEIPEGVQGFNLWTRTVMAHLWDTFPRPQFFQSSPVAVLATPDFRQRGTPIGPEGPEQVALFAHTLAWLIAEGFATGVEGQGTGDFANVVLTTKGFSVLNHVPRSVSEKSDGEGVLLGTRIREAAVRYGPDLAVALVRKLLER
jgi:hypothetical protein